jgi:hypothetical protein
MNISWLAADMTVVRVRVRGTSRGGTGGNGGNEAEEEGMGIILGLLGFILFKGI